MSDRSGVESANDQGVRHDRPGSETIDVLVVGAGVAGASAALVAARRFGAVGRVLLVDRCAWPREKVCGCCLGARGVASLSRLGIDLRDGVPHATPLTRVRVTARGGASFDLPHAGGAVVSRAMLDDAIVGAAMSAGAAFRPNCPASVIDRSGGLWRVRLGDAMVSARAVIVADGLGGRSLANVPGFEPTIARSAFMGVGAHIPAACAAPDVAPAGTVLLVHGVGGYVGLVRLPGGAIDVAAALSVTHARAIGGPVAAMRRILSDGRVPLTLSPDLRVAGTPLLTRRRSAVGGPGLIIAGDAAGYVEPFTGEGMTWAVLAGEHAGVLAASAIMSGASAVEQLGLTWSQWHRRRISPMQTMCRSIRVLLRTPGLLRGVAIVADRSRSLRSALAHISTRVTGGSPTSHAERWREESLVPASARMDRARGSDA